MEAISNTCFVINLVCFPLVILLGIIIIIIGSINTVIDWVFIVFRISMEIASGMRLLEKKGVIHRDLAARNVLVTFIINYYYYYLNVY